MTSYRDGSRLTVASAMSFIACVYIALSLATVSMATPLVNREQSDADVDSKHNYVRRYYENYLYRHRTCLEQPLESREHNADVILTGTIRALEPAISDGQTAQIAHVEIKRIIKGVTQFGDDVNIYSRKLIKISGIGDSAICHSRANIYDSFIFLASSSRHHNGDDRHGDHLTDHQQQVLKLNSSLVRLTLRNIEQIELLVKQGRRHRTETAPRLEVSSTLQAAEMSTTRRPDPPSTVRHTHHPPSTSRPHPCSTLTCSHGAKCVSDDGLTAECQCPRTHCDPKDNMGGPVCGSDGQDYMTECEMRHASCLHMKDIHKKYDGYCDSCRDKQCPFHAICVSDGIGGSQCVCPSKSTCSSNQETDGNNICGSDGHKYNNECEMQITSCIQRKHITQVDPQICDPCINVQCTKRHQRCVNGQCICPQAVCPTIYDPVCGTDLVTYPNQCTLDTVACGEDLNIETMYPGVCVDDTGSGIDAVDVKVGPPPSPVQSADAKSDDKAVTSNKCDDSLCHFGAICHADEHRQQCVCQFNCDAVRSAVCGSDGKIYPNECQMKAEACNKQTDIRTQPLENCEDLELEVEVCDGRPSLINPHTGHQYNCDMEACPSGSYCHKVPQLTSRCCLGDEAGGGSVKNCEMTEFGCCPDGLTAAFGPKYAGCPSECMCNGLGSVALTCHPVTGQCPCKSAVGGLRCDRCEPSYWGLQNIGTNGKTGCTPCGCNVFGSVREDCDQMNGKCLCRPGITGPKCTVCPNGSHVGPHGCIGQDNMQNDFPAAAMTKSSRRCSKTGPARCRYGAFCDVTGRCVCQDACSIGDVTEVCGSDAVTYKSRCYLRLASCQQHKRIVVAYSGHC